MTASSEIFGFHYVGPEDEASFLDEALTEFVSARQVTMFVHGEAGIGLTALLRRFAGCSWECGTVVVLAGRCPERANVPCRVLDGVIDALARYLARLPRSVVESLRPRQAALLVQAFPVLGSIEALAEAPRPAAVDPLELRPRTFAVLRELLGRLADRRPLIIVIDDLQWADDDGLALLANVLAAPDAPSILLLGSWRAAGAEVAAVEGRLSRVVGSARHLRLSRLGDEAARALARQLLARADGGAVDELLVAAIAAESLGHPLFIQALVHERTSAQRQGCACGRVELSYKENVEANLWHYIGLLDDAARRVLEVVMVAGEPIDHETAAHAAELSLPDYLHEVRHLRADFLVRVSGMRGTDQIEPFHNHILEAFLARLPGERARELHEALARALERKGTRR